jgi:glycosyltransferase involved in cell wall biosynthesis
MVDRDHKKSILIVKLRVPYPLDAGTDIVSYGVISALRSAFEITLLSADQGARSQKGARHLCEEGIDVHLVPQGDNLAARHTLAGAIYRNSRRLFLGLPNTLQMDACRDLGPALRRLATQKRFDLVQFEYWNLARHRSCVTQPAVLVNHDAWFQTAADIATHARSRKARLLWRLEARTVRRHELAAQKRFDWRLSLSDEDRRALRPEAQSLDRDVTLPVPFVFEPVESARRIGERTPRRVAFVGGLTAPFNVDAAGFFAKEIWPLVHRRVPDAEFAIVGANPPPEILGLSAIDGVRVEGYVADLREYLREAAVAVSPCRIGTGIKVKVAEAMAAALPVVGTTIGLSGYAGADCLVRADGPAAFAEAVVELLQNEERRRHLAQACLQHYRNALWIETVAPKVVALYERMVSSSTAPA